MIRKPESNRGQISNLSPFLLCGLLLLVGCAHSPPIDYYLLSADAPLASEATPASLGIAELKVAEYLQQPELLSLDSANHLRRNDFHRWAEPLQDGIERTLLLNLGALLGSERVRVMPWPRDWMPQWILRCHIARLDIGDSNIELIALWSLQDGQQRSSAIEHTSRLSRPRSDASIGSAASDISQLLVELSTEIADASRNKTE